MYAREAVDRLRSARSALASVEEALVRPSGDVFTTVLPRLEEAARLIGAVEVETGGDTTLANRAELRTELQGMKLDLKRVSALLRGAADLHSGWAELLALAIGGYNPAGNVVAMPARSQISLEA